VFYYVLFYIKKKLYNTFKICLKQPRLKNGAVPQKVLQLQPIVENSIEPDISLDIMKSTSTISDLNYEPLNKNQKVFINISFFI